MHISIVYVISHCCVFRTFFRGGGGEAKLRIQEVKGGGTRSRGGVLC